jgi:hypothetical protein
MSSKHYNTLPEQLTIGVRATGSFTPIAISKTPYVSFQIIKETTNAAINTLTLYTSNCDVPSNHGLWPSGSTNEYLYYADPDFTMKTSGTLTSAPFSTGSAAGSVVYHVGNLNARWARIEIKSNSGGVFRLASIGKE